MPTPDISSLDDGTLDALERLESVVAWLEQRADPEVQERGIGLLQAVDLLHRAGVARLAALLDLAGPEMKARALDDPAARLLLEMYDLAPPSILAEESTVAPRGFVPLGQIKRVSSR
ncbi:MAG: hypothetical protein U0821_11645 [Chloroflexota bacterium]